jgi:hypothetical protein
MFFGHFSTQESPETLLKGYTEAVTIPLRDHLLSHEIFLDDSVAARPGSLGHYLRGSPGKGRSIFWNGAYCA